MQLLLLPLALFIDYHRGIPVGPFWFYLHYEVPYKDGYVYFFDLLEKFLFLQILWLIAKVRVESP